MIKIEIDEKIFNLPQDWSEVSLGSLIKLTEIQKKPSSSEIEQTIEVISAISDLNNSDLMTLPIADFKELSELVQFTGVLPSDEVKSEIITIDGIEYSGVDITQMTAGEFISLEVFQKEAEKNIHFLASILVRPIVDGKISKLDDMPGIIARAELFKEKLMVADYYPLSQSFFVTATNFSSNNSEGSSDLVKSPRRLRIISS